MYPVLTPTEPPRAYPSHERRPSYPSESSQSYHYSYLRTPLEPPRPLEPRPSLQTSFSEASIAQRRQDSYRGASGSQHNLPGLRDILTPTSHIHAQTSYGQAWNSATTPTSNPLSNDYTLAGIHPPLLYPPHNDGQQRTQNSQAKPTYEVPILETTPVSKHPLNSLPVSPYTRYPDATREYVDTRGDRPIQPPPSTYMTNGMISPYTQSGPDYRTPGSALDRSSNAAHAAAAAAAENQQKYVGLEEVPGEGTFHLYENGYRIPAYVDGEYVNPQWGLTKANKPRKRLALACLDCREKKIKCEPGGTSCLQCEKAKRPCRRPPTHQSQSETPTTATWPTGSATSPPRKVASSSDPTPTTNRDTEPDPLNKRRSREDPSPPNVPKKKHRSASPVPTAQDEMGISRVDHAQIVRAPTPQVINSPRNTRTTALSWDDDPYAVDRDLTLHLLDRYFAHINNAMYSMFPRGYFLDWVQTSSAKCQNERMVLYAMLAAGSIFADDGLSSFGKQCARIAEDAVTSQFGKANVSLAQSNMLLSLYHFARNSDGPAWDYVAAAVRIVNKLQLNAETKCIEDERSGNSRTQFMFSREQLSERKRRTFWSAFLMDRFCNATTCNIKPEDVFVRLPCTDLMYEQSAVSDAPFFNNDIIDPVLALLTPASPISPMGWLVVVAAIFGDVGDFMFRSSHRSATSYGETYETFYNDICNRLQGWQSRLPDSLQFNESNLDTSIQQGYADIFVSMHVISHFAMLKLNRCMRHAILPDSVPRNIRTAHSHGHHILYIMSALCTARKEIAAPVAGQPPSFTFSTPFPGYATLSAIDVVSGGGLDSNLGATLQEVQGGLDIIRELSQYWISARDQLRACEKRFYQIRNVMNRPNTARSGCWLQRKWGVESPLEPGWKEEFDCIYGLGDSNEARETYYGAFQDTNNDHVTPASGLGLRLV